MESRKSKRVWVDGCFDMVHFGHANVVRQAKALGDHLVVGIHSDEEICRHKGPPVFSQEERYTQLKAIKWVDEVVKNAPYMTQLDVLEEYGCDFCAHGDDISLTSDGKDAYEIVKNAGKYVEVHRTEGISTTDLLYRILRAIKVFESRNNSLKPMADTTTTNHILPSTYTSGIMHYMPNALRIAQFMTPGEKVPLPSSLDGIREPRSGESVVYVPGAFDLFHVGHVNFLERCRMLGTYIIVGLHSDEFVNNVILDAPYAVTEEMVDFFKVSTTDLRMMNQGTDSPDLLSLGATSSSSWEVYQNRNKTKEAKEAGVLSPLRH